MTEARCRVCDRAFMATRGMHGCCSTSCRFARHARIVKAGCWEWTGYVASGGYGIARIRFGATIERYAHRAAFRLAYGPVPDGKIVCHKCNNRRCVRPDHLYAGTYKDNAADMVPAGTVRRGERSGTAVLTDEDVRTMRRRYAEGSTLREIGADMGLREGTVQKAVRGETWSHVPGRIGREAVPRHEARGTRRKNAKLTEDRVRELRKRFSDGETQAALANEYGVDNSTVSVIVNNKAWKHVS